MAAAGGPTNREKQLLSARLKGRKIAIDVQHLYHPERPADAGTVFHLVSGHTVTEGWASSVYAEAMGDWFRSRGAAVLTNSTRLKTLLGYYSARQREAEAWGADLYLACHVNAGRGSYARMEYAAGNAASPQLPQRIGAELVHAFPEIISHQLAALRRGDRGMACVQGFAGPHVLLEPFFGDNPRHQALLTSPRLGFLGETIALAVADWMGLAFPAIPARPALSVLPSGRVI